MRSVYSSDVIGRQKNDRYTNFSMRFKFFDDSPPSIRSFLENDGSQAKSMN